MPKFQSNDLNGVMPAMITSFNKDESINKEGLRNIINHSINEKVNGLYVTGSTGETFLMSPEEKKKVIDIIVEEVNIRTTKFKTLENTYFIVPNSILAGSEIENISAPYNEPKNVRIKVSVAYGSDIKKVKEVLKKTAESVKYCLKNSVEVYFTEMGNFSLDFLVVFKVKDASKMWPAKVEFLEKAYENLNKEGIEIPFPTQTIYLKKE
jgi:small-conductance mechanosensitive channel